MLEVLLGYATNVPRIGQLNPRLSDYAEVINAATVFDSQRTRNVAAPFQVPHNAEYGQIVFRRGDRYAQCSKMRMPLRGGYYHEVRKLMLERCADASLEYMHPAATPDASFRYSAGCAVPNRAYSQFFQSRARHFE